MYTSVLNTIKICKYCKMTLLNGALPQTPVHSFARPKERNQEKAAPNRFFKGSSVDLQGVNLTPLYQTRYRVKHKLTLLLPGYAGLDMYKCRGTVPVPFF